MVVVVFTACSVAVGYWRPRASGVWIAGLAWPVVEWLGLTDFRTNPPGLLVLPAVFCALSAYAGLLIRRRTTLTR